MSILQVLCFFGSMNEACNFFSNISPPGPFLVRFQASISPCHVERPFFWRWNLEIQPVIWKLRRFNQIMNESLSVLWCFAMMFLVSSGWLCQGWWGLLQQERNGGAKVPPMRIWRVIQEIIYEMYMFYRNAARMPFKVCCAMTSCSEQSQAEHVLCHINPRMSNPCKLNFRSFELFVWLASYTLHPRILNSSPWKPWWFGRWSGFLSRFGGSCSRG